MNRADPTIAARIAAALIALAAWAGLAVQLQASTALTGSAVEAAWAMLRFFTVLTNLLVALLFTSIAVGRQASLSLLGGTTLAIVTVGVVYELLLKGLLELSGGALLADFILHRVTPIAVPLYWLVFAPKGGTRPRDALLWALYPLGYFGYALVRGASDGRYPYPFIDVGALGWAQTGLNASLMAAAFILAGLGLIFLDQRLKRD